MLLGAAGRIPGDWRGITAGGLRAAAAEGFTVLNIVVTDPDEVRHDDVVRLKRMFADAGLQPGQTNGLYGGVLVSTDEAERAAGIEFMKRMCGLTSCLGAPNTYLRPGSINPKGPWLPHPENRSQRVFDRLVDSAQRVCRAAEDEDVKIAVEGGVVSPLYSARRVRNFIDAVGSPAMGFNQDPVNFVGGLDDAYDMKRFLGELFDLLGDVTIGAHVKDFRIVDQLLVHLEEEEIGSGLMDHELFLRKMQGVCPDGHVLIEHIPPEKFAEANRRFMVFSDRAGIVWESPPR
jgi:sugar phosphate isomerase/epimerase